MKSGEKRKSSGGMGERGVTRGMGGGEGMEEMTREDRLEMLRMHHHKTLWVYWLVVLLGFWMMAAPFTLGHLNEALWVRPSGGRGAWFGDATHDALRAWLATWSDVLSGALLVVFGWRSLRPNRPVSLWICCSVGIWLSLAPLLLWSPTSAAYTNQTVVGMLVIALTVLIPGMPNMIMYMKMGPPVPPGWTYNPSSWPQRSILIALAFAGLLVSRQLAAFQLGYTDQVWEPFFGDGSRRVLNSQMSHMWPISDAALGAFAYTLEFLMGWMGSPMRWRTMPWMVTFFGILVIPLGLVHIFLVISQPVVVGAWCTLCLVAAALMLPMIPLQVDEVIAMGQHMVQARRRGESLWEVFWKGGDPEGSQKDERTPEIASLPEQPVAVARASLWGMSFPWTLWTAAALGVWLMFAPAVFGTLGLASDVDRVGGALIVVTSVIAMGEPLRAGRFLNALLALAVIATPWIADGAGLAGRINALVVGSLVIALSVARGPVRESYGAWDRGIF
jgi:uncharacterized membrane protein